MNVGNSVGHALGHWGKREWDAAMLHACNAVDATGKKRYPKFGVGRRFTVAVRDSVDLLGAMAFPNLDLAHMRFPVQVRSNLPDRRPDIADVLYGVHRCSHGHGDDLPAGFELVDYINNYTFRFQAGKDGTLRLPAAAVLGLLAIAVFAPENVGQHAPGTSWLSWSQHKFPVNDSWGKQDQFRDLLKREAPPKRLLDWGHWWDEWTPVR
ncbi:hypothetical protein [Mycobacterium colombiense]|uniref:hypothetical protein n=1 Tax=Mycobacterium colombiense TaxID=339268 RepID=UPI00094A0ADA|nr:hypothetical protein [Mycobacterium colombiense]